MGVVNVTPDSFSDGGRYLDHAAAVAQGQALAAQGADIVDVGGESTRPGADPVGAADETARVVPVVEGLVAAGVPVSIDTRKAEVAEAAVAAGACLINDVTARLAPVAAAGGAGFVAMHMQGDPRTMQHEPVYDDVVAEVRAFLVERAEAAVAAGVPADQVWVDPGIGFGKRLEHNLELLANLDELVAAGFPVLVGTSRKSMLGTLAAHADRRRPSPGGPAPGNAAEPEGAVAPTPTNDRIEGSLATATWALWRGAAMVRVHEVVETMRVVEAVRAMAAPAA
jgi:dihydropteroate synthase